MPSLQELEAERQAQMDRLAELVDRRQRYTNQMGQQEQSELERMQKARRASDLNYGDEAAQGAMMGYTLGLGSPVGAAIGAGYGALSGGKKAYDRRREEGKGRLESFFGTLLDVPNMIPTIGGASEMLPSAAAALESKKAREERTSALDTLKDLRPQQPQAGTQQIWEGASPGFEFEKYEVPKKYWGSM